MVAQLSPLSQLQFEIEAELTENILPFHMSYLHQNDQSGLGFHGRVENDLSIDHTAPKGLTQCSRLLWTYARAYRIYGKGEYIDIASIAYRELIDRFYDTKHGGFYWSLTADGQPLDRNKLIYGQAFAIYALSEMHMATGNQTALNQAIALFRLLEKHAVDPDLDGYWEACNQLWEPTFSIAVDHVAEPVAKSMNTHLHVLEAYTNLVQAWPDPHLIKRLHRLIDIHLQHIIDSETGHLMLHFSPKWEPLNDLVSYGHDIEASWLLWEAAEILGDETVIEQIRPFVIKLAQLTEEKGVGAYGGLLEEGDQTGIISDEQHWWPQAEAMVGWINAFQLTGDERHLTAVLRTWHYIQHHIIDQQYGGWIWGRDGQGNVLQREKAGMWKTPYHNGRACFELLARIPKLMSAQTAVRA